MAQKTVNWTMSKEERRLRLQKKKTRDIEFLSCQYKYKTVHTKINQKSTETKSTRPT